MQTKISVSAASSRRAVTFVWGVTDVASFRETVARSERHWGVRGSSGSCKAYVRSRLMSKNVAAGSTTCLMVATRDIQMIVLPRPASKRPRAPLSCRFMCIRCERVVRSTPDKLAEDIQAAALHRHATNSGLAVCKWTQGAPSPTSASHSSTTAWTTHCSTARASSNTRRGNCQINMASRSPSTEQRSTRRSKKRRKRTRLDRARAQRDANERGREVGGLRQSVLSLRTQLDDARNCVLGRLLRNYTSSSRWERGAITILTLYLHACTDLAHGYLHCFSSGRLWIYPRRVRGDRTQSAPLCGG